MGFGNALYRFLTFMVIFMAVFLSFVYSSRTRLQIRVAEDHTANVTQDLDSHLVKSLGKGASAIYVEDSAREVPTGPDPLHHNRNPTRP